MNRSVITAAVAGAVLLGLGVAAVAGSQNRPSAASELYPPVHDVGTATDVESVRAAVPRILNDWVAAGRADGRVGSTDIASLVAASLSDTAEQERRALLSSVLAPSLVDAELAGYEQGFRDAMFLTQPLWLYVDNDFVATSWDGVQVIGDTAVVLVQGQQSYVFLNGTTGEEPVHQFRLVLQRDPGSRYGWVALNESSRQGPS